MATKSEWSAESRGFVTVESSDNLFKFWLKGGDMFVSFGDNVYQILNPDIALEAITFGSSNIEEIVVLDEENKKMLLLKELITEAAL